MRWSILLPACAIATVAFAQDVTPLPAREAVVLAAEHHANQRAIALGALAAEAGSARIRTFGRDVARDLRFADDQVVAYARLHGTNLELADPQEHFAEDRLVRIAKLDGLAFDRAVLDALADELGRDLTWIDDRRQEPLTGDLLTLFATMRPSFARYQGEAQWLGRRFRPAS